MTECTRFDVLEAVNSKIKFLRDVTFSSLVCKPQKHCIRKQHNLVFTYPNTWRRILEESNCNIRIKYEISLHRKLLFVAQELWK